MMITAIHGDTRSTATSAISTPVTSSLSAVVSRNDPSFVVTSQRRARQPSTQSVSPPRREQDAGDDRERAGVVVVHDDERHDHRREEDAHGRRPRRGTALGLHDRGILRGLSLTRAPTQIARRGSAGDVGVERAPRRRRGHARRSSSRSACLTVRDPGGGHAQLAHAEAGEQDGAPPGRRPARRTRRPSGRAPRRAADDARRSSRSTGGCGPVEQRRRAPSLPRSAAIVYCARSLVPIEKKSTSRGEALGARARRPGTSTITPDLELGGRCPSSRAPPRAAPARRGLAERRDHREHDLQRVLGRDAQDRRAAGCASSSGWASDSRMPRTPRNGLSSGAWRRNAQRLVGAGVERADDQRPARRAPRRSRA